MSERLSHGWQFTCGVLRWINFTQSRFATKHQHGESSNHVVHGQIYQPIRNFVVAAAPNQPIRKMLLVTKQLAWLISVIWPWHPWRQLQETRFAPGFEKKSLYRLCYGTKCLRLSSRNFLTREMLFPRHHQDAGKRTQLSGSYLCVFGFWLVRISLFSVIWLFSVASGSVFSGII